MSGHNAWTGRHRTRLSRRRAIAFAGSGFAAAWLSACGQKAGKGGSAGTAPATSGGQPQTGGTLAIPIATDFFDFDPSGAGKSVPNPNAFMLAYDTLLNFQQGTNAPYDQNMLAPSLAASWESPDAQTYTFHLQKGVKFANLTPVNGRPLTAADVKWSFSYHSRTGDLAGSKLAAANFTYMFEGLDRIETPDDSTVVVRFSKPFAPFLNYNYTFGLPIMPHEIFDQDGKFSSRMVGTGPFQLDQATSQHGTRWVFKKNPDFWQSGKPYLDEIRYLVLPDDSSAYAAFQTGQAQILHAVNDLTAAATIKRNSPHAVVEEGFDPQAQGLYISQRRPPFTDARLRKALSLALDRDEFDRVFAGGKGGWVLSDSLPGLWTEQETKQILSYDPAQAKQLVGDAGYGNGLDVELMLMQGTAPQAAMELLQAQFKRAGINLTIRPVDKATGSTRLHSGDFTLVPTTQLIFADLDSRLFGNYHSSSPSNYIGVKDQRLDQLIEAQRREADTAKRRDALRAVTRYMAENAVSLALYRRPVTTFWTPSLNNYGDNWQQYNWNAPNIWLSR